MTLKGPLSAQQRGANKMRITKRRNRTKYGIFRVSRKAYQWQSVRIHLAFYRDFVLWERHK